MAYARAVAFTSVDCTIVGNAEVQASAVAEASATASAYAGALVQVPLFPKALLLLVVFAPQRRRRPPPAPWCRCRSFRRLCFCLLFLHPGDGVGLRRRPCAGASLTGDSAFASSSVQHRFNLDLCQGSTAPNPRTVRNCPPPAALTRGRRAGLCKHRDVRRLPGSGQRPRGSFPRGVRRGQRPLRDGGAFSCCHERKTWCHEHNKCCHERKKWCHA